MLKHPKGQRHLLNRGTLSFLSIPCSIRDTEGAQGMCVALGRGRSRLCFLQPPLSPSPHLPLQLSSIRGVCMSVSAQAVSPWKAVVEPNSSLHYHQSLHRGRV